MAIEINDKTIKDRLFFHERDGVFRLSWHSTEQTATVRSVSTGKSSTGVIGCSNFREFSSVSDMDSAGMIKVIDHMAFRTETDKTKIEEIEKEKEELESKYQKLYIQHLENLAGIED